MSKQHVEAKTGKAVDGKGTQKFSRENVKVETGRFLPCFTARKGAREGGRFLL